MSDQVDVVDEWTAPIDWQLLSGGAAVDLTDCTATLRVRDHKSVVVTLGGTESIVTPASGLVRYAPVDADFDPDKSPYTYRWRVVDATGKVSFFPNAEAGKVMVRV